MRGNIAIDADIGFFGFRLDAARKAHCLLSAAMLNQLGKPVERAAADKQNVFRVDLNKILIRMLSATLRRNIGDRSL